MNAVRWGARNVIQMVKPAIASGTMAMILIITK
jgi:hypothetical protein